MILGDYLSKNYQKNNLPSTPEKKSSSSSSEEPPKYETLNHEEQVLPKFKNPEKKKPHVRRSHAHTF